MLRMKSNINPTPLSLFLQLYAALFSHLQVSEIDVHLTSKCVFNEIGFFFLLPPPYKALVLPIQALMLSVI